MEGPWRGNGRIRRGGASNSGHALSFWSRRCAANVTLAVYDEPISGLVQQDILTLPLLAVTVTEGCITFQLNFSTFDFTTLKAYPSLLKIEKSLFGIVCSQETGICLLKVLFFRFVTASALVSISITWQDHMTTNCEGYIECRGNNFR